MSTAQAEERWYPRLIEEIAAAFQCEVRARAFAGSAGLSGCTGTQSAQSTPFEYLDTLCEYST